MEEQSQSFDVCIVCALPKEAKAVINVFSTRCKTRFTKAYYGIDHYEYWYATILNASKQSLTMLVTWLPEMGPTAMAQEIKILVQQFHPRFVGMTGICAGDQRKVQLGDLIIASVAYHYEEGKITRELDGQTHHQPAPHMPGPADQMLQYAKGFEGWLKPITKMKRQFLKRSLQQAEHPQQFVAPMASGMAVHADDPFPWLQRQYHRNTLALDMEAASFYSALRSFTQMLVVKGVCDFADMRKNDGYHEYAARVSAVYLLYFIREYVTDETISRRDAAPSTDRAGPQKAFMVPYPPNSFFTGRDNLLATLELALHANQPSALSRPQAIRGLGGVGKTQIAVEYAHRYRQDYQAVFWVSAPNQETLLSGFAAIADLLQLPECNESDQTKSVLAVKRWLQYHQHWLLILDSADDLSLLPGFLPSILSGHVILTTRVQALGGFANHIEVTTLDQPSGTLLLLHRAGLLPLEASLERAREAELFDAQRLWQELDGLPLALDQAGAFIEETKCSLSDYLHLFQTQRGKLLQQRGGIHRDHPDSVFTTFTLAANTAAQCHPALHDLLRICALLHHEAIPEEMFLQDASHLSPVLEVACLDLLEWNKLLAAACAYSLLQRQPEKKTLSIHRLVQAVLFDSMTELECDQWTQQIIQSLETLFPDSEPAPWKQSERLLLHTLACLERVRPMKESLELASLRNKLAMYLCQRARYVEAEPLYQQALHIREQMFGPEHLDVAQSRHNLANLYVEQGKYAEAELQYQQAIQVKEALLEPQHLSITLSLHCLANLYAEQGKYTEAKSLYQRILHIHQQTPDFMYSYEAVSIIIDFATLCQELGEYAKAETLYQQMLQVFELVAEPPLLGQALLVNNMAVLYKVQGKYTEAEPLYQQALHIREQVLGPEHPDVAQTLHNLANLCVELSQYTEAEPLYQRALHIRKHVFGPEHADVAQTLLCLAMLYHRQGKYSEAEQLYEQVLQIDEQKLGPFHPSTASCLDALANLYHLQGKYNEARPLYQRALQICTKVLGPEHPDVAQGLSNLANLYADWGKCTQAELLYQQALHIREQKLGPLHPDVAQNLNNLATIFCQEGKRSEAEPLYQRALQIREQVLGPEHPDTASTRRSRYIHDKKPLGKPDEAHFIMELFRP